MNKKRGQQIDQIFNAAIELPRCVRDAFVRQACADDLEQIASSAKSGAAEWARSGWPNAPTGDFLKGSLSSRFTPALARL